MSQEQIIEILEQQLKRLSEYSMGDFDEVNLARLSEAMIKLAEFILSQREKHENRHQP